MEPLPLEPAASNEPAKTSPTAQVQTSTPSLHSPMPILDSAAPRAEYDTKIADRKVKFPHLFFDLRFWQLAGALLQFVVTSTGSVLFPDRRLDETELLREKARAVRQLMFDLGPTFIKLGQFLSVRRDVLPIEFAEELSLLQDQVPPFDISMVRETICAALGAPPEQLFLEFETTPIASASIGQVHRVKLKDGGEAVIKVQRPGLAEQFYRDLGLMRLIARWWVSATKLGASLGLHRLQAKPSVKTQTTAGNGQQTNFGRHRPIDVKGWLELSDEFGRVLFSEIDYIKEGRNADRLRKLVRPKPQIRVPRVHWRYTGRQVLTLEYIPGIKISQVKELQGKGFDLEKVGNMLVNCYLEQFVLTGFFHADPHAGNLAIDNDGRLIIYDFGMMGEISEQHRHALLACVMAVVRRNSDMVTISLQELGIVSKTASAEAVSRAISPFIDYYAGKDILDLDFHNLEADIDQVITERSFRLPANLAYLLRAGSSLEGIARTLKPDFSFVAAVRPVMTKWVLQQGIETLAKNGKLLTFAQFAFNEIRASVKQPPQAPADNSSNGRQTSQTKSTVSNSSTPSVPLPTIKGKPAPPAKPADQTAVKSSAEVKTKLSGKGQANAPASNNTQNDLSATETKCTECSQYKNDMQNMHQKLLAAVSFMWVYLVISLLMMTVLPFMSSLGRWPFSLYFLIGNISLGAIIIWKFTKLLKLSSQRSGEVQNSEARRSGNDSAASAKDLTRGRGNGDK